MGEFYRKIIGKVPLTSNQLHILLAEVKSILNQNGYNLINGINNEIVLMQTHFLSISVKNIGQHKLEIKKKNMI